MVCDYCEREISNVDAIPIGVERPKTIVTVTLCRNCAGSICGLLFRAVFTVMEVRDKIILEERK